MSIARGSAGRLRRSGLSRALREPELLHHPRLVPLFPSLDDFAVSDAIDNEAVDSHAAPGRWDAPERRTVRSFCNPSKGYLVPLDDLIFDGETQIREGREQTSHHLLESFNAQVAVRAAVDVNDAICRKDLVGCRDVSAVQPVDPGLLVCGCLHAHLPEVRVSSL